MRVVNRVRTVVRDGRVVRVKRCGDCGQDKQVSASPERSEFYVNARHPDGRIRSWQPRCKRCELDAARRRYDSLTSEEKRERNRQLYEREMADPERAARRRERARARARRDRQDPARAERLREHVRRYHRRRREEDPERVREDQRMRYRLNRERAGKQPRAVSNPQWVDQPFPRVTAEPFRNWLVAYATETETHDNEMLAADLGIERKRVSGVLNGAASITQDVVDRALLSARVTVEVSGTTVFGLADLYPVRGAVTAEAA